METRHHKGSILMLPWLAQGHIVPYFELAKKLSHQDFNIYICSTPINLKHIREKLFLSHSRFSSSIQLIDLHLPCSLFPELPPHHHTTKNLPPHLLPTLSTAFQSAEPEFCNILKTLKPDLVIYDLFQPWAPKVAHELNIEAVLFLTSGAGVLSWFFHAIITNPSVQYPFPEFLPMGMEERQRTSQYSQRTTGGGITYKDRTLQCVSRSSTMILIKTSREIEAKFIDYLSILTDKQMVPVGLLVDQEISHVDSDAAIFDWLSKKAPSSIVFSSFGSEYLLAMEEIREIANGLELSEVGFIWAIRLRDGDKVHEALPEGFVEKIGERGLVVEGWAPQTKILEHSSIGGFVSHCGWGSTTEAMIFGVPIIAMPMQFEQPMNAKLAEDIGVGKMVPRENEKLNGKELAKVIKEVMLQEEGKQMRRKAEELSSRLREKADEEMDVVVVKLVQLKDSAGKSAATASTDS